MGRRLLYEPLEKRLFLSADFDPATGAVRVVGTSGADLVGLRVVALSLRVDVNGTLSKFPAAEVKSISIDLGDGNDTLGVGPDIIGVYALGGLGDDVMTGGTGKDTLTGGGGRDTLNGSLGDDRLDGGPTNDYLIGSDGSDRLYGSDANDTLDGGAGVDRLFGDAGNDSLIGGSSNDKLYGLAGNDTLNGGNQNDLEFGGDGNDSLLGGDGTDTLFGQLGDDDLNGQLGDDLLSGEAGFDFLDGSTGNDTLDGGDDDDTLLGFDGNDRMTGGNGDDMLKGEKGDDVLDGSSGNDSLYGGADDDELAGSDGNDGLFGGSGTDRVAGNGGADRFLDTGDSDDFRDVQSLDAVIVFQNLDRRWSDLEIQQVDEGFGWLVDRTGNTKMLKQSNGLGLTIRRRASLGTDILGTNSGRGRISMADLTFQDDNDPAETVVHEIGHNWDEPSENPTNQQFRDISGWYQDFSGDWNYTNNAGFASEYAKTNVYEDFAESLAIYFTKTRAVSRWQAKYNYIDQFLTRMSK